ncbi:cyclopropane-fatty-acyl-phospholipid synthase family protein [Sphingomonas sp. 1P06PA]|uniref:class I SAM-dependent methyltransferase n=1 Tax=Sphingomonas sp. 1P06PA TaxID=554121 RepID=UPI0039A51253
MNAPSPRGRHLVTADRGFAVGGGLVARVLAPGARRALDRIDRGLAAGAIDVKLPDGSRRLLGGRGAGPIAVVDLRSWRALVRLFVSGSVGWYRAWAEGEWASPDPVALFHLFVLNRQGLGQAGRAKGAGRLFNRAARAVRRNTRAGARRHIAAHYDLGNDFYAAWLDQTMTYSSAVFADPADPGEDLGIAQKRKNRLLLDRLALKPGDRLLEIGCGWGELARTAAADHCAQVTGLTLSAEQKALAEQRTAGLPVTIDLRDYRDACGPVDAVVSVEMVEAVGEDYWRTYLETIARVLKPGGRAAIQYICIDPAIWPRYAGNADFIQTYIFPGGLLIHEPRFRALAEAAGLRWEDRSGYGLHYAETLRRWRLSFDQAVAEDRLPPGFDARFDDLWRYYLMYCEGGFRGGGIDVAQVTLVRT